MIGGWQLSACTSTEWCSSCTLEAAVAGSVSICVAVVQVISFETYGYRARNLEIRVAQFWAIGGSWMWFQE